MGSGPLSGVKVLEFAGIGPGPFCGMLLADMGAEVIRIDRKGGRGGSKFDVSSRGKKSIALDLKKPEAIETCLKLIEGADILQEGFRPGALYFWVLVEFLEGSLPPTKDFLFIL